MLHNPVIHDFVFACIGIGRFSRDAAFIFSLLVIYDQEHNNSADCLLTLPILT